MSTGDLQGKVALVTGSSRGLGRHYALQLAQAGADVIIHDVSESAAAEFGEAASGPAVAGEIESFGRKSAFFAGDLSDAKQAEKLVNDALDKFGRLDILVNNAGGDIGANTPRPNPNDAIDISSEDIRAVVDRNLITTMYTCKYAGAHMRERGTGKIVNVGSVAGHVPVQTGIIYAAAKMAVSHYTRCLADELRPYNVNVNCIAPAATYTGRFSATRTVGSEDHLSRLQQTAQPKDMADIVMFLVGSQSDYLSGETIVCWTSR
ncbi:SDR family NAD(P)-dependent oxidoreductase [Alicyclobacillus fodiniaquatilis]|uniref:SDR family NAD(P)-dependent oxidoreductase n=1 Tax=Alicyclobacillus fodiniaquatilis TaxID=1661150 RepID=A0ABW4JG23_9BACL